MRYLILLLLLIFPIRAHAMPQAPDDYSACAAAQSHTANIILQSHDQALLNRVKALKAHLRQKNQDPAIITALYKASLKTGVDFDLLVMKAMLESDLGRLIETSKSSARGVFQYIEPTWLGVIRDYGERLGYPHYAAAVRTTRYGRAQVSNDYLRAEILSLRYDPQISALVKAYQIQDETAILRKIKGNPVTMTDHYIAHMLGMPLAKEFYTLKRRGSVFTLASISNPAMREAVRMNKIFFYKRGTALTASQSYRQFEKRVNASMKAIADISKTPAPQNCP